MHFILLVCVPCIRHVTKEKHPMINTDGQTVTLCTIPGHAYRAAFTCKAPDDDYSRPTITGLFLSLENSEIVGTNGHIMYTGPLTPHNMADDVLIKAVKIPARATDVVIESLGDGETAAITAYKGATALGTWLVEIMGGRYPNYRAVVATPDKDRATYYRFGFDAKYLAMLKAIFGPVPLTFGMAANTRAALVTSETSAEDMGTVTLMPIRVSS